MTSSKQLGLFGVVLLTAPAIAWGVPYSADLQPLNDSGVNGSANMNLDGDSLSVDIDASGLEENQTHPQHIHGLFDDSGNPTDSTIPEMGDDTDGDGFIELEEGAASYGPVILPLTTTQGQNGQGQEAAQNQQGNQGQQANMDQEANQNQQTNQNQEAEDNGEDGQQTAENQEDGEEAVFPTADGDGNISFSEVYDLSDESIYANDFTRDDLLPLEQREIILHGLSTSEDDGAGTPGEVDGTAGYKDVLPVAAGTIEPVSDGQAGQDGADGPAQEIPEPGILSLLAMGVFAFMTGLGRRFRRVLG
ncbi:hypothetical protein [Thiohalorhabdus methylotrophus]|uniref:PEP-CTERM protein-sorting domain-containing protein n=1 Tax=Thiohalorhabdus methylotrophus TaxID=3242694 RepID=A0ABV4TW44_9GAMM